MNQRIVFHLVALFAMATFMASCEADDHPMAPEQLVVEGWIDEDGYPMVFLTTSLAPTDTYMSSEELSDHLLRWARVTVSDGEQEVVLMGKSTDKYFPPYVYTTVYMKGIAGRTYKLTVDYGNHHAEAETTIPKSIPIDTIWTTPCEDNDTLFHIHLQFTDNPTTHDHYMVFTRTWGNNLNWMPCFLGSFDDANFSDSTIVLSLRQGLGIGGGRHQMYFDRSGIVDVKLAHIDSTAWEFWQAYGRCTTYTDNFLSSPQSLPYNVHGALGYWQGMGADFRSVRFLGSLTHFEW